MFTRAQHIGLRTPLFMQNRAFKSMSSFLPCIHIKSPYNQPFLFLTPKFFAQFTFFAGGKFKFFWGGMLFSSLSLVARKESLHCFERGGGEKPIQIGSQFKRHLRLKRKVEIKLKVFSVLSRFSATFATRKKDHLVLLSYHLPTRKERFIKFNL